MLGPFTTARRLTPIHQMSLAVLSRAACASMSTTTPTTTTTTRDRGDRYGMGPKKAFPYSLPSVGHGADPGAQAVSPQVTLSYPPGGRLPLLSAMPAVTSVAFTRWRHPYTEAYI